jgi:hypothetical protein
MPNYYFFLEIFFSSANIVEARIIQRILSVGSIS